MTSRRNILLWCLLAAFCSGCASFWHDLRPHRIRRLNRGPAPSLSPEFTRAGSSGAFRLAHFIKPNPPATMTANRAEVTVARGQNLP